MDTYKLPVSQEKLLEAWNNTLPNTLNEGDSSRIWLDERDGQALRIHIDSKGRQGYGFDFRLSYLDPREVKVDVLEISTEGLTDNDHEENVKALLDDYVRHIHESAQALQSITHPHH